ncbi:hypothetical protein CPAR01_01362 [Colletotrichum paranaense]|uniref:Uncharacterized protein n=1 Tax=Colletotrichum paranaense TaxID=1914294 RepID=A0ABQ9T6L0_9PEZI|nr:uncharacterized protein CPAR01_01362 [Colletotrichum paranaense]KAK1547395.1 hypothetical protein CPAR01_01362 [Colletotrichum paranaense]
MQPRNLPAGPARQMGFYGSDKVGPGAVLCVANPSIRDYTVQRCFVRWGGGGEADDGPASTPACFRSCSVDQGHSPEKRQERDAQLYASNRIPGALDEDLWNLHSFRYERDSPFADKQCGLQRRRLPCRHGEGLMLFARNTLLTRALIVQQIVPCHQDPE